MVGQTEADWDREKTDRVRERDLLVGVLHMNAGNIDMNFFLSLTMLSAINTFIISIIKGNDKLNYRSD